ncbi:carbon-nitrogen hydrolase family protein [Celeribacter marinus]|uniref:carbon-nitrogen hydrolase family protein n=1 Tax=Celeribacter marinus TaxID=1397108 RepID=UPI003F6C8A16
MTCAALITLNSCDDPVSNLKETVSLLHAAADGGADFIMTPEVTNCISTNREHKEAVLCTEADDITLSAICDFAALRKVWVLVGSLALKTDDVDGRFANRSFLISPLGKVAVRYDKAHMFDVTVSETETYLESAGYRPGNRLALGRTPFGVIGMSVCYDLRFAYLYRSLAQAGAEILTVPSAFSAVTGAAHWEVLLRARAIETGSFVFAPAQTGVHRETHATKRQTYGHSLVVSPWGDVVFDGGVEVGVGFVDFDLRAVHDARSRIPSLLHDRVLGAPQ